MQSVATLRQLSEYPGTLSEYFWNRCPNSSECAANQAKTIRLPVHVTDKLSKIRRMSMELEEEFDREPTDDELGEALGKYEAMGSHLNS